MFVEEVEFFATLEMYLRQHHKPITGNDHLRFRSYYHPVKVYKLKLFLKKSVVFFENVIDGDLCEMFGTLPFKQQQAIATELAKDPPNVLRKLENLRTSIL